MGSILFFLKCLAITVVFVLLLQIRVGDATLEDRADYWMRSSPIVGVIDGVAQGGLKVLRDSIKKLKASINTPFWNSVSDKASAGSRAVGVKLERSKEYVESQTQKAKEQLDGLKEQD